MTRFVILTALVCAGCAGRPVTSSTQNKPAAPVFELQKGENYFAKKYKEGNLWYWTGVRYAGYPEEPHEFYETLFGDAEVRFVFGLGGPFALEDGKIPVFVCDVKQRQFYRFGGSVLYCPKWIGGPVKIALSANHPHPQGLELAPGKMPRNRVRTVVYRWRDDKIDKGVQDWMTTAYCVAEGGWNLSIWCEPFKP